VKPQKTRPVPLARRECGPCRACCQELKIDTPELKKKAGLLCRHHTGTGCGIYATRPPVCRQFLCGWRLFEQLDETWRPDLSGVLIVKRAAGDVAKDYRDAEHGLSIVITGGEAAIRRPGFAEYVVGLLKRGVPVEMSATSPATLLNHHLEPQEAERNLESTRDTLCRLYGLLKAARWRRGPLMLWHLYRLEVERQKALMEKRLSKNKPL
jgi:hypothetical protein